MEKLLFYAILALSLFGLTACGDKNDEPKPTGETVHRTVLVYMVADNSLGTWGRDDADIKEMLTAVEAGGLRGGRLIVYHGRPSTATNPPLLLDVTDKGVVTLKTYPVTDENGGKLYSVDPGRIREVVADTKEAAPADEYAVVFWSHSNGWLGAPREDDNRYRAFGDDRGHHITIPTLARTLEGERFSFVYFDCCQMANVESAYELRRITSTIIGSPTELGIDGMRYDLNVPVFFSPNPDLEKAARNTYEDYSANGLECQMSVIRTSGLDRLASATRDILATLSDYPDGIEELQRYCRPSETCWSYDMRHYMQMLAAESHPLLYVEWEKSFASVVTYAESTPTAISDYFYPLEIKNYCGLGMFALSGPSDISYRQYDHTAWWTDVASTCPAYK